MHIYKGEWTNGTNTIVTMFLIGLEVTFIFFFLLSHISQIISSEWKGKRYIEGKKEDFTAAYQAFYNARWENPQDIQALSPLSDFGWSIC